MALHGPMALIRTQYLNFAPISFYCGISSRAKQYHRVRPIISITALGALILKKNSDLSASCLRMAGNDNMVQAYIADAWNA